MSNSIFLCCSTAAGLAWASLELIAYIIIRPLFIQLLDNNPKLKGNVKKQARTAVQMLPRVVCFIHNLIQVLLLSREQCGASFTTDIACRWVALQSISIATNGFRPLCFAELGPLTLGCRRDQHSTQHMPHSLGQRHTAFQLGTTLTSWKEDRQLHICFSKPC